MKYKFLILIFVPFVMASIAFAHAPIVSTMSGSDISNAIPINHIEISQVLYKVFDRNNRNNNFLWITFEGTKGQSLYFQPGVPKIEKFKDLKPEVVIVGPGLPKANDLPFEIPTGMGALEFTSTGTPTVFYEPVTDTYSWIYFNQTITLPESGRYYIVSFFPPSGEAGNLFIAVGKIEQFTPQDIINVFNMLPQIRAFYGLTGLPDWMNVAIGISAVGLIFLIAFILR